MPNEGLHNPDLTYQPYKQSERLLNYKKYERKLV